MTFYVWASTWFVDEGVERDARKGVRETRPGFASRHEAPEGWDQEGVLCVPVTLWRPFAFLTRKIPPELPSRVRIF